MWCQGILYKICMLNQPFELLYRCRIFPESVSDPILDWKGRSFGGEEAEGVFPDVGTISLEPSQSPLCATSLVHVSGIQYLYPKRSFQSVAPHSEQEVMAKDTTRFGIVDKIRP